MRSLGRIGKTRLAALALLLVGVWQFGHGVYLEGKAWLAQLLLRQAWEETLAGGQEVHPWPWADTWPVARMQVARLGVDRIVLAGASGRTMAFGPAYVLGTAPLGGAGNSVISGHRDTHFLFLRELRPQDRIELTLPDGSVHSYVVEGTAVHRQTEGWLMGATPESRLTLITCYPFDALVPGGPLRYVVQAKPLRF